jgi:hypothetical protein
MTTAIVSILLLGVIVGTFSRIGKFMHDVDVDTKRALDEYNSRKAS